MNAHRTSNTLNLEIRILKSISHDARTTNVNAIIIVLDQSKKELKTRSLLAYMTIVIANLFIAGHRDGVAFNNLRLLALNPTGRREREKSQKNKQN